MYILSIIALFISDIVFLSASMALRVDDVMQKKVHTIDCELSTKYAAKMMDYLRISSLVVLSNGRVVGI